MVPFTTGMVHNFKDLSICNRGAIAPHPNPDSSQILVTHQNHQNPEGDSILYVSTSVTVFKFFLSMSSIDKSVQTAMHA